LLIKDFKSVESDPFNSDPAFLPSETSGIDTPQEALYYANGGILQYVLRQLLAAKPSAHTVGV
jgi:hypothetical protein